MKKMFQILKRILNWSLILVSAAILIITIISKQTFSNAGKDLFGYRFQIVLSDSMKATDFAAGDLIMTKYVNPSDLKEGDIISYISTDPANMGHVITHKIREVHYDANGYPSFTTYGTTTGVNDGAIVTDMDVIGKYQMNFPGVGTLFQFLRTPKGFFSIIFPPFMLLIAMQLYRTIQLFIQYRKELEEEKMLQQQELEEERKRNEALMEELKAFKASAEQSA